MPPIIKENDILTARPETAARPTPAPVLPGDTAVKQQPVALEVTVTVNGARTIEGSDKREPFSETTKTVLVFGNGAVIRLSSSVAPGQLLFLTNEKTKKEVVCQVVKSKNYRNVSGYVELEFTESIVGFWGMRFPSDRIGSGPQPTPPAPIAVRPPAVSGSPVLPRPAATNIEEPMGKITPSMLAARPPAPAPIFKDQEPKLSEAKFVAPEAPRMEIPAPPLSEPSVESIVTVAPVAPGSPAPAVPEATVVPVPAEPVMPGHSTFNFPRTSEAQASILEPPRTLAASSTLNLADFPPVPELEPAKPAIVPPPVSSDPETEALKQQTARLQEQLSSLLFAEPAPALPVQESPVAPVIEEKELPENAEQVLETAKEPEAILIPAKPAEPVIIPAAPLPSSLDEEELKIPAWLEPLARNAAAPASTQELVLREKARRFAEQAKTEEAPAEPTVVAEEAQTPEVRLPLFVSELRIDEETSTAERASKSSHKGLLIAAIAAGVLLLAGGGWWYMRPQPSSVHATVSQPSKTPAPVPSVPAESLQSPQGNTTLGANSSTQTIPAAQNTLPSQTNSITQVDSAPAPLSVVTTSASTTPARNSQSSPNPANGVALVPASASAQPASAQARKPLLGEVRWAAPKVAQRRTVQNVAEADAGLALNDEQPESSAEALSAGLAGGTKQPAAPAEALPVGGDVKPAKLISSVPPVYPLLAKNQHVSGNVVVDALIDANGRVTTVKVISGPALLHQAAMDALKQWKYQPATLDGKPTAMHLTVTLQFRLQ
jgi:TonB family protein